MLQSRSKGDNVGNLVLGVAPAESLAEALPVSLIQWPAVIVPGSGGVHYVESRPGLERLHRLELREQWYYGDQLLADVAVGKDLLMDKRVV